MITQEEIDRIEVNDIVAVDRYGVLVQGKVGGVWGGGFQIGSWMFFCATGETTIISHDKGVPRWHTAEVISAAYELCGDRDPREFYTRYSDGSFSSEANLVQPNWLSHLVDVKIIVPEGVEA